MQCEIICAGTELLLGQIVNTNSVYLSGELARAGINLYKIVTVGDNLERLREAVLNAWENNDLVIITGGLGPTEDDLTRQAISLALEIPLERNPVLEKEIRDYFVRTGRKMTDNNLRQAMLPLGAEPLVNKNGTAPGIFIAQKKKVLIALPGVPEEMKEMFEKEAMPRILDFKGEKNTIYSRVIRVVGIGESSLEEKIRDILQKQSNPTVALLAKSGEIEIRLTCKAENSEKAQKMIAPVELELKRRLGLKIYGYDEETLEKKVNTLLRKKRMTLAVCESCTGGFLGERLTSVAGSSEFFQGGLIAYSNNIKMQELNISEDLLKNKGAVSKEVAGLMASEVARKYQARIGIGITGIAGPGGGSMEKPVGLVYIALAYLDASYRTRDIIVKRCIFNGDRQKVRYLSTRKALDMIRLFLLEKENF